MFTEEFRKSLDEYISLNYVESAERTADYVLDADVTKDAGKTFSKKESFTLDQLMEEVGESFHDMLFLKIDMSGMTDVEVYKKANIDRKLFSKIRSNPAYHPRKQTVLALAIALKLSIDDTVDLLARAEYVGLTDAQIQKDHQMKNLMDVPKCDNEEFDYYVRNKAVVRSVDELQRYLQKHANTKPFEINVRLDFTCNIKEMAQKASDYVVKHFVIAGGCVDIKVDSQYREGQNILIMTGR